MEPAGPNNGVAEQRCAPRTRALKQTFIRICRPGSGGRAVPVHVRDVSCRGIGFVHNRKLEPGTQFAIELIRGREVLRRLLYVVVRCRPWDYRSFLIGARFVCVAPRHPQAVDAATVDALRRAILA